MAFGTSNEVGGKPYRPDLARGYWAQPRDFVFVCLALGLKLDIFLPLSMYIHEFGSVAILIYILAVVVFIVPLVVIQSFMGQFSSSGFITSLRLSPAFKGLGYIALLLNITVLSYYSLLVAVPLLYLIHSFRPTLPWSCEAVPELFANLSSVLYPTTCNASADFDGVVIINGTKGNETRYVEYNVPSIAYYRSLFGDVGHLQPRERSYTISAQVVLFNFVAWAIVGAVLYKFFNAEKFGKLMRYALWVTLALLVICFVRVLFLPHAIDGLVSYLIPDLARTSLGFHNVVIGGLLAFGSGWGSLVALASFNKFSANITRYSWLISAGQLLIFTLLGLVFYITNYYFKVITNTHFYSYVEDRWVLLLSAGSAFATMHWANFWSILFFSMLTLAGLLIILPLLYSVLVSLFDEFQYLRNNKSIVIFISAAFLFLISIPYCANNGISNFSTLAVNTVCSQTALNIVLIIAVLWVYGRQRFQRDFEFMLNRPFATWKVNATRFVVAICYVIVLLCGLALIPWIEMLTSRPLRSYYVYAITLPWLILPAYFVYRLVKAEGTLKERLRKCFKPNDWYPVLAENRQRYEDIVGRIHSVQPLQSAVYPPLHEPKGGAGF